jgi:hypothetical protein
MGNSGERRFLQQLKEWMQGNDEVLAESAGWAAARIEELSAGTAHRTSVSTC